MHWRTSTKRLPGTLAAHAALVAELRQKHPNLRIAACTVDETDAQRLTQSLAPAGKPELWLLAAPQPDEGRHGVRFLPLANLPKEKVARLFATAKNATVVFDADYLSWQEALTDSEPELAQ